MLYSTECDRKMFMKGEQITDSEGALTQFQNIILA
jgi:hypothetical protein